MWPLNKSAIRLDGRNLTDEGGRIGPGLTRPVPPGQTWRGIIELWQVQQTTSRAVAFDAMVRSPFLLPLEPGRHTIAVRCAEQWSGDVVFFLEKPRAAKSADELVQSLREFPAGIPGGGRPEPIERRRVETYDKLWSLGPAALPALCRGLGDPDVQVRRNAALFLNVAGGDWYDRQRTRLTITDCAVALVRALDDSDGRVRELSAQSVPILGAASTSAVPALIRMLSSASEGDRNTACIALGGIGPRAAAALPALKKALGDSSADVRSFAKRAIERIER
jgi:HEAT repeat protein